MDINTMDLKDQIRIHNSPKKYIVYNLSRDGQVTDYKLTNNIYCRTNSSFQYVKQKELFNY